ncbi:hypothetical protein AA309_00780 [Microvirga vignae]|uniref:Uncharacterized protein n=1 Tax=Microvirga vignae TaxID=1225564 RepID=A0A0H1RJ02_9HYPH|nr:hypothetical protein AA309_00780 [Microvirga vignae]
MANAIQFTLQTFKAVKQLCLGQSRRDMILHLSLTSLHNSLQFHEQGLTHARNCEPLFRWDAEHFLKGRTTSLKLGEDC